MTRLSGCSTLFTSLMPTLSSVTYRGFIRAFSWQRAACYSWTQGDSSRENQHRQVAGWKCKSKHWKMLKCLVRVWWSFSVGFSLLYTVIWSNVDIKKKIKCRFNDFTVWEHALRSPVSIHVVLTSDKCMQHNTTQPQLSHYFKVISHKEFMLHNQYSECLVTR